MREIDVPAGTRILRTLGGLLVLLLALAAAFAFAASKESGKPQNDGARSVGATSSSARGAKAPAQAEPTAAQKAQVRETRVSPFNEDHALVAGLDPALRTAVQSAARTARAEGIEDFWLTSGWRTSEYQEALLTNAIKKHGSLDAALQWVKTAETSEHVQGSAADVGPTKAAYWMSENASRFGLCRTYANEVWHYELAQNGQCPAMKEDARG